MTEIVLARHGQTAWNVVEVFRGQTDVELNETGLHQAELLADYLLERKIEAVYSSPMIRALKTAAAVAGKHDLKVIVAKELNDLKFGAWEGLPLTEVKKKFPDQFAVWETTPHLVKIPGGENLDDVARRATSFVNSLTDLYHDTVVLVTHRVVVKVLTLALLGLDNSHFWNIRADTAAITTFAFENRRWVLNELNNTCYLKPLQQQKLKDF